MLLFLVIFFAILAALAVFYRPSYVFLIGGAFIFIVFVAALAANDLGALLFSTLITVPIILGIIAFSRRRLKRQFEEDTEYLRKLREEKARAAQASSATPHEAVTDKS